MTVVAWRCAVCSTEVGIDAALMWRCPRATPEDWRHVLIPRREPGPLQATDDTDPLIAFDAELAWAAFADAHGLGLEARLEIVADLEASITAIEGHGFITTPLERHDELSRRLGFHEPGGVWIKDETGNVAGSHKARHLVTILLHLLAAERLGLVPWTSIDDRPPLAISSCGNAAIAASTLAAAARWPIAVMVPTWAEAVVTTRLDALGAEVTRCPRRDTDPPGDPCLMRFREAVGAGAIPFSVQGPENAWCLDGGRTLGFEIARHAVAFDRVFIQVGGGAFAACVGAALVDVTASPPRLHAVQAEGCAPLARAWECARGLPGGPRDAPAHWARCMEPWPNPGSLADGILDDETYDWLGVLAAMDASGGGPVVAPESDIRAAHELLSRDLSMAVSPTGSAGLAGVMARRSAIGDDERVLVVASGIAR